MTTIFLAAIALASAAQLTDAAKTVTVTHQGAPVDVRYVADVDLQTKQVGTSAPTRMGTVRCDWTATVTVKRSVGRAGDSDTMALARAISAGEPMRGSRAGDCMTNRRAIVDTVAGRQADVDARIAAAMKADRPQVLADLEAAQSLASTD